MSNTVLDRAGILMKRIVEEENNYLLALRANKSFSILKGYRIILNELRKELKMLRAKELSLRFP
jgi:hypothetical protein